MSYPQDPHHEPVVEHHALPGDPGYVPDAPAGEAPPPPPPPRPGSRGRIPLPVIVLGAVLALAMLVVASFAVRNVVNKPATVPTASSGPADHPEPRITLPPRTGTPAPVQTAKIGERVQVQGIYGRGTVMLVGAQWSDRGDLPPKEGMKYLNLDLRYDSQEGSLFTSPNQYAAYDPKKVEYLPGIGSGKAPLGEQEIKANSSTRGWVSIEMPAGPALVVISDEGINPLVIIEIPKP